MADTALTPYEEPVLLLSPEERRAYERFLVSDKPKLSADLAGRLYHFFLNGHTCSEIHNKYSELPFGAVVAARVQYKWDESKARHAENMMARANERAAMVQVEAVDFLFDLFSVTHKVARDAFDKYRITGNEDDLKNALRIENPKQYRELLMALMVLMGKPTQVHETKGEHHHSHTVEEASIPMVAEGSSFLARKAAEAREAARKTREATALPEKKAD